MFGILHKWAYGWKGWGFAFRVLGKCILIFMEMYEAVNCRIPEQSKNFNFDKWLLSRDVLKSVEYLLIVITIIFNIF